MPSKAFPDPTRAEYEVLKVLWALREASIREVHDRLSAERGRAYSTTKTTMDRMAKKGLLDKHDSHGVFLYTPLISKPAGLAKTVKFLAEQVLEVSYSSVVNMFAQSDAMTPEELKELRALLKTDRPKKGGKK